MKNLLVICLSLLLTLGFAETVFRLLEFTDTIPPEGAALDEPKDYMKIHSAKRVSSHNPLLVSELDKRDPRVNSIGIRDREFSVGKTAGKLRIAAMGDSVTFGLGVPADKTFPKLIEQKLATSGINVEVMNFGISAYDTVAELELYKTSVATFNPDIVILTYILNDPMRPGVAIDKILPPDEQSNRNIFSDSLFFTITRALDYLSGFSHFFRWIDSLWDKIVTGMISEGLYHDIYRHKHTWGPTSAAITGFAAETHKNADSLLVVVFPLLIDFNDYIYRNEHQQVVDAFSHTGTPVLDMLPLLANESPEKFRLNNADQTHPNEYGHQYISDAIINFMQQRGMLKAGTSTILEASP